MPAPSPLPDPYKTFSALSFRDLVEARDFCHSQLMRKQNVIGTAIGRYLQRKKNVGKAAGKTLFNTEIRHNSWPCLLVFVDQWATDGDFGKSMHPGDYIPASVEMPDGRIVPLCVVQAPPVKAPLVSPVNAVFPDNWIGGGYPLIAEVQNQQHIASIGGMLTDGHLVYAITNRHVAGAPGEVVYSILDGERVAVGKSSRKQLTRMPFEKVYPGWPGKNVFVEMDIGLVEVEDATCWTSQIYGIGKAGSMVDLSTDNFSLRLIDGKLHAYGCASGRMHGRIIGMFYRFKAVSGFEYVADFLIGPDQSQPFRTHHGDSGTLWLLEDPQNGLMPLAIQWGGQVFGGAGDLQQPFALATNLSTVCRVLDVDFVQDWNSGQFEYWGAVGHYTIASVACDVIQNADLKKVMQANADSITFPTNQITAKNFKGLSTKDFVPLADVPDMVWKVGPFKRGGMSSPEHGNHFADMDKPDSNGDTLLQLCEKSDSNINPAVWLNYYNDPKVKDQSKGLLPFRCWQIYDEMVKAVKARNTTRFVCAAGILSHYVGDACQPLHISYMFNGDPAHTETVEVTKKGVTTSVVQPVAKGVHSAYEDGMVNFHSPEIMTALDKLRGKPHGLTLNSAGGFGAAKAVLDLMQQTFKTIKPADIVNAYVPIRKLKPKDVADHLWQDFGEDTINIMEDGARTLAMLWDSAWKEGGGTAAMANAGTIPPNSFKALYIQPKFLESFTLAQIQPVLSGAKTPKAAAGNPAAGKVQKKRRAGATKKNTTRKKK